MKNLVMLTENELGQVSGGVGTLEALKDALIKSSVDKLIIGPTAIVLMPLLKRAGEGLDNFLFGEPEKKEEESKKVAHAA